MPDISSTSSWTAIADLDSEREYVVLATRFVITGRRHIAPVVRATRAVWPALAASGGLLGYSRRIGLARGRLSTLSVWSDPDALDGFVRGAAHARVVAASRHRLAGSAFADWTAPGADLPPSWATAERRLDAGPRD